jgi:hypothetical protein
MKATLKIAKAVEKLNKLGRDGFYLSYFKYISSYPT